MHSHTVILCRTLFAADFVVIRPLCTSVHTPYRCGDVQIRLQQINKATAGAKFKLERPKSLQRGIHRIVDHPPFGFRKRKLVRV